MKRELYTLFSSDSLARSFTLVVKRLLLWGMMQCAVVSFAFAQESEVTINQKDIPLGEIFRIIGQQTGYKFFYNHDQVDLEQKLSMDMHDVPLTVALDLVLHPLGMSYKFVDKTIVLSKNEQVITAKLGKVTHKITGQVKDEKGEPMAGVTVYYKQDRSIGTAGNANGVYTLFLPELKGDLVFSFMGMKTQVVPVNKRNRIDVVMETDVASLEELVVTGYVPKAKGSFTGTAVQVKGEELRNVSPTSLFDALKVFDPSFAVVDDEGMFGSNPNRVPDKIEIRGQNSIPDISQGNLQTYTSLPVFIMDGFQIDVQQVFDLDMNRIQSVTILKDAAAAAIYGSRAANGVVVIETKIPESGKLRFSYTFNGSLQVPDLSSYHLMDAGELLEYYRRGNMFSNGNVSDKLTPTGEYEEIIGGNPGRQNLYMLLKKEVEHGVNTYWLSQPLRTSFQHTHTAMLEGGMQINKHQFKNIRYQVTLTAAPEKGVMKGSERNRYGAGLKLLYNDNRLQITNDLQAAFIKSEDSPYGDFSTYAKLLPFYRTKDENGKYFPTLSYLNIPIYEGFPGKDFTGVMFQTQLNPLYDARYLSSFSRGETTNITYNLGLNWEIVEGLRMRGTFSLNSSMDKTEKYDSPMSAQFYDYTSVNNGESGSGYNLESIYKRGKYVMSNNSQIEYSGNVNVSYTKNWGRHLFQGIVGGELHLKNYDADSYSAVGFLDDALGNSSYAIQFNPYAGPGGSKNETRSAGSYLNLNYSYDNRYLLDVTGRIDGSSNFASKQRTAPFWALGVRWNVYNEAFMRRNGIFENLALRASVGTKGNQNFQLSQIMDLYNYGGMYEGVMGAEILSIANPELKWQTTLDRNIGLEFSMLQGMMNFDFNFYSNITRNNLTDVEILPSTGFSTYKANMGNVTNKGVEVKLSVTPIRGRDWRVNFFINGAHNKNELTKISDALSKYNESVKEAQKTIPYGTTHIERVFLFEEGQSLNSIYAVRSLGIDPGTGQEMFLTKDGRQTFKWNTADQVIVGNTEPTLKGFFGLNVDYRRWSLSTSFQYSFGSDRYNKTLYEKVEGNDFSVNADRRALYDRWMKPGDIARYKGYANQTTVNPTSRFVQKENFLTMNSLRLTYTLNQKDMEFVGMSLLKISLSTNDLFYVSTIKQERGLSYPFARKFYLSLQANF